MAHQQTSTATRAQEQAKALIAQFKTILKKASPKAPSAFARLKGAGVFKDTDTDGDPSIEFI